MNALTPCPHCGGFLPRASTYCPHCKTHFSLKRIARAVALIASSGGFAATLMACYGLPPCDASDDQDKDGHYADYCYSPGDFDCDDTDPAIHPNAADPLGDNIDQNCDGEDGIAPIRTSSTSTTTR